MYSYADVQKFLGQELGTDEAQLSPDISLLDDLGVDGDQFDELMGEFAERFGVDMSGYLWYFHHGADDGPDPADLFFRPQSYDQITVTPRLLLESANAGRWLVEYPPHRAPQRGYHRSAISCLLLMLFLILFPWAMMKLILLFFKFVHRG
jgi:acyl carrier protein